MNSVKNFVLARVGYKQGAAIGTQSDKAKWWLFALGTGVPVITSSLGVIPKFFYPINNQIRDEMYGELAARRSEVARKMDELAAEIEV